MKVKGTEFVVYGWLLSVIVWKVMDEVLESAEPQQLHLIL